VINPIPRFLWPEKRYPDTPGVTRTTSLRIRESRWRKGGTGIVADLYMRFGLGGALFLFWLGKLSGSCSFQRADWIRLWQPAPTSCSYAVSLNVFAQEFRTVFVSFGYSMAPVAAFTFLSANRRGKRFRRAPADLPPGTAEATAIPCS